MLIMQRRVGEAILLGDDVEVRILSIGRNRVKVGITAPRATIVRACEIELVRDENRAAAQLPAGAPALVARLLRQCGERNKAEIPNEPSDRTNEDPAPACQA